VGRAREALGSNLCGDRGPALPVPYSDAKGRLPGYCGDAPNVPILLLQSLMYATSVTMLESSP